MQTFCDSLSAMKVWTTRRVGCLPVFALTALLLLPLAAQAQT
jgi:hypothetical protein